MRFPNMFLTLAMMVSSSAFATQYPKDLKVTTECRETAGELRPSEWLAHVGYSVIDPAKVTVSVNNQTHSLQIPDNSKLISISADGHTALLWKADSHLSFASMETGEVKDSGLLYADVLKRWEIGDNNPGRRVHLLSLHGLGSERDKALFDRRVYYGILVDTYKEDKKVSVYNMDGTLKQTCDFSGLEEKLKEKADTRYEFVNQAGPQINEGDKTMVDFVIYNTGLMGHIDLWSTYFSVQKRTNGREMILSGFCK